MIESIVPSSDVPLIDPSTGIVTREWYKFFSDLSGKVDSLNFDDPGDPSFAVLADAEAYSQALVDALRGSGL